MTALSIDDKEQAANARSRMSEEMERTVLDHSQKETQYTRRLGTNHRGNPRFVPRNPIGMERRRAAEKSGEE